MSVYQARVNIAPRFGVGKEPHGVPIFLATCIKQSINLNKTLRMSLWEARRVIVVASIHKQLCCSPPCPLPVAVSVHQLYLWRSCLLGEGG